MNAMDYAKSAQRIAQTVQVLATTGAGWLAGQRPPTPILMRQTFERLGTTYIKLGQFIASAPSLFPTPYVEAFQNCLDRTPPVAFSRLKPMIAAELGRPLGEIYRYIDPQPLASASIAQVHPARLVSGEEVVIKIQKPGVEQTLATDLNLLYAVANAVERLSSALNPGSLTDIVGELQGSMLEECDFLAEAGHLEAFRAFLAATDNRVATAPVVYHHASSRRVLTLERLYGVPLTDLEVLQRHGGDPASTLQGAMDTWFDSLLQCETFHADVHAGNLLILEDGRVGFIDFGIVGRIDPEQWQSLGAFFQGIVQRDYATVARAMMGIGATRGDTDVDALTEDLKRLRHSLRQLEEAQDAAGAAQQRKDPVDAFLLELMDVGRRHGLRFPRSFTLLLKQFLYFDRYFHLLNPKGEGFPTPALAAASPAMGGLQS
ncbi:MAG: ABC1 kinase family protein [Candidatus Competibacterales bacterium]